MLKQPKALIALLSLALLGGCSGDPAMGRLGNGTHATTYDPEEDRVYMDLDGGNIGMVNVGVKVLVVSDEDKSKGEDRPVRVNIQEGQFKGRAGLVRRNWLRPAP